jgi:hypothetical protein
MDLPGCNSDVLWNPGSGFALPIGCLWDHGRIRVIAGGSFVLDGVGLQRGVSCYRTWIGYVCP